MIRLSDEATGLQGMHDMQNRAGKLSSDPKLRERGDVEMANPRVEKRSYNGRRIVRLDRIERFTRKIVAKPPPRAGCGVRAHADDREVYWNVADQLRCGRVNVHRMGPPI